MNDDVFQEPHTALTASFSDAFSVALKLHRNQARKGSEQDGPGIPYMAHLMSVAALVLEHGGDEEEAIAALLHDGPEDQGGQRTLDDIRDRFGGRVADIVEACSDTLEVPKPEWRARKERYLDHLRKATNPSVFLVSAADKVHNLRSILGDYRRLGDEVWERFKGKKRGTLWYYGELLRIFQERQSPRCGDLVGELERTYLELTDEAGETLRHL